MFLRSTTRKKDGKDHRYWSVVENRRVSGNRTAQRHVLYLGEINDSQQAAWSEAIEVFDEGDRATKQVALFPEHRHAPELDCDAIRIRIGAMRLCHPRQWGACWLSCSLWDRLRLDEFWNSRLEPSRKGTSWLHVLKTLVSYQLIDPGSEWRLHRQWYDRSAMGDLLGCDARLSQDDTLYRCLDKIIAHKQEMFGFLQQRWRDLFHAEFDVLLYDLTSTYFEIDPSAEGKRKFGYSRDKRSDCVQVVIALMVTPDGLPLAYEVLAGNTSDRTTLKDFLAKPWSQAREQVQVKLVERDGEVYVLARSHSRRDKERAMRRRRLKHPIKRLKDIRNQKRLTRTKLLMKLGAAQHAAGNAYSILDIHVPKAGQRITAKTFTFTINRQKLREARRREGSYLLRSNLTRDDPEKLWLFYLQLVEVEQAFKELKNDLSVRPIYHQLEHRIEAHIFIAFMAYCLQVTLKQDTKALAPGLTPRAVIEKMASIQMIDVHLPTTDGRQVILSRYTEPEKDHRLLLQRLKFELPAQPKPRITANDLKKSA